MDSAGLDEHFQENHSPADSYEKIEAKPIRKDKESDDDHQKRMDVWKDGETKWKEEARAWKENTKARGALGKVVPNSLYMEISEFKTFHEMWNVVVTRIE